MKHWEPAHPLPSLALALAPTPVPVPQTLDADFFSGLLDLDPKAALNV